MKKTLLTIASILIIAAITFVLAFPSKIPEESNTSVDVYFCPRDNCSHHLYAALEASQEPKCAFYDINLDEIKAALDGKKLVMDDKNKIKGARSDNGQALMHNKFCILDNGLLTGSFNPTARGNTMNNNNLVVIHSNLLKKPYEDEFDELWGGYFGGGKKARQNEVILDGSLYEAYFCPEDGCEERLIKAINSANSSIHFMVFSFTSRKVADALISAANAVEVKGVMESSQNSKFSQYSHLKSNNIDVNLDANKANMHHKVFIIDDLVVTGSYNPTQNGNKYNDENVLVIHDRDIADEFENEFSLVLGQSLGSS
ncbi:MAG: phospholipase D-like domain-containing protein [Candidatus Woesearchaeota archaeon]